MKRIYPDYTYGSGPRDGCWWDETIAAPAWPLIDGDVSVDVAIIGGGFTGMSAALHLAEAGVSVAVAEAGAPGWGASGRNGGFCCLGGGRISDGKLNARYGAGAAAEFRSAEIAAVNLVRDLLAKHDITADTHSQGETLLAHSARQMEKMRADAAGIETKLGVPPVLTEKSDLARQGLGGDFHGALTIPIGFGLNPRKYLFGLADAAADHGVRFFQRSPVSNIEQFAAGYRLHTPNGTIRCDRVIVATNGYSSENVPEWLAGRYMPTQSSVLVTRPLSDNELAAQGWTSDQMSYDSCNLLHYFRLMPDRRFLFGMRGGLMSSERVERGVQQRVRRDFERMFPAWAHVETPNSWSGLVCLSRNQVPYCGPVDGMSGVFAGLAYHGNGVAMGSWTGAQLAGLVGGTLSSADLPRAMVAPMGRFPLGGARRALMPPVYAKLMLADLF